MYTVHATTNTCGLFRGARLYGDFTEINGLTSIYDCCMYAQSARRAGEDRVSTSFMMRDMGHDGFRCASKSGGHNLPPREDQADGRGPEPTEREGPA